MACVDGSLRGRLSLGGLLRDSHFPTQDGKAAIISEQIYWRPRSLESYGSILWNVALPTILLGEAWQCLLFAPCAVAIVVSVSK